MIYRHVFHELLIVVYNLEESDHDFGWAFRTKANEAFQQIFWADGRPFRGLNARELKQMGQERESNSSILMTCHQVRNEAIPILSAALTLYNDSSAKITSLDALVPSCYLRNIKRAIILDVSDWTIS